ILFFFQAKDGIRVLYVTGVQTCALPISPSRWKRTGTATTSSSKSPTNSRSTPPALATLRNSSWRFRSFSTGMVVLGALPWAKAEIGRASCRERGGGGGGGVVGGDGDGGA